MVQASGVVADEGDVINLNATLTSMRDNNLFRLAPSVDPKTVGLSSRADTVTTTTVGLNFDKKISLQRIVANASLVDNRYQNSNYLNFRGMNYDAKWLWAVGLRWTGELAVDRSEALNSFTDYTNANIRNVRTATSERFTANYWFHSNWAAMAGVSRYTLANEQPFLADSDYELDGYNVGLRYRPRSGNTLTLRLEQLSGNYSKRQFNTLSQYDNGFSQQNVQLAYNWQLTGKSQITGRLEHIDRKHDHFASRDYAGWIGNIDYNYAYSGKGRLTAGLKRSLETYQQTTTSYYVLEEANLALQWAATGKLLATARMGVGQRAYRGEIVPLPAGFQQREEKFTRLGADLAYHPLNWVELKAGLALENRNSNLNALDYKDRIGYLSATAQY